MSSNTKQIVRAARFFVRAIFLKLFHRNSFKTKGFCFLSSDVSIEIGSSSKFTINNWASVEKYTLLAARSNATLSISEKVFINRNCTIVAQNSIVLEEGVTIGPNCCIFDHDHDMAHRGNFICSPVVIKRNVWIGAGVTILKGVTIGEGSIVAAGAVVNKSVPPYSVIGGVPAKVLK